MANWDGSARSMEGEGGRLLIIDLNDNEHCFVMLLVKDNDGTITASASPRPFTKQEKNEDMFSPKVQCLKKEVTQDSLPFISS